MKRLGNMKVKVIQIVLGAFGTISNTIGDMEDQGKNREYPDYFTLKIILNTEKNPGELKRLDAQISMKNYQ